MQVDTEEKFVASLRPKSLSQFIGQDMLKVRLGIAINSALLRHDQLSHVLLTGPRGLGKTSIAQIIAEEMNANMVMTNGVVINSPADLMCIFSNMKDNTLVFIDEAHRIPRKMQEHLYSAMEDFVLDCSLQNAKGETEVFRIPIPRFTLVAATTHKGLLNDPLVDRFGLDLNLSFYDAGSLAIIAHRTARVLDLTLTDDAAMAIALRARGTPRIANRLVYRVRDFAVCLDTRVADVDVVNNAMSIEGIDHNGLSELDRRYLGVLTTTYRGGPVGMNAMAETLQEEAVTIEETVEPYLLREEFLLRTTQGRKITSKGLAAIT